MTNKPADISNIAKSIMTEGINSEHISSLAKLTAKQIYSQGYQAGEMANKTDIWNLAIEAAANVIDECNKEGPYNAIGGARRIRELKK